MSWTALIAAPALIVVSALPAAAAQPTSSPAAAVTAVVVKSWGGCFSSGLIWDDLNANWSSYGSIKISIDYDDPNLCVSTTSFTLADLEANGADVVILNNPSG